MGQFSWLCSVCGKQIISNPSINNQHKAVLVTPTERYIEDSYNGYGVFGGVDAYTWLACCFEKKATITVEHPANLVTRERGIWLNWDNDTIVECPIKVIHQECDIGQNYFQLKISDEDPNQGRYYDSEEEDEEEGIW